MMSATRRLAAAFAALALLGPAAGAQPGPDRRAVPQFHTPHIRFDARHLHNHYYPERGYVVPRLPSGSISIAFGGGSYYFHAGVWYRASGTRFVVVRPPIGIFVPILPAAYVTLWISGTYYYYANGIYYAPAGAQGYVVVEAPAELAAASAASVPEPVIYPRNGQSAEQTEVDRRECNRWATSQPSALNDASVFQRAVAACMEARGYTVR
jgi:hypothetical protein